MAFIQVSQLLSKKVKSLGLDKALLSEKVKLVVDDFITKKLGLDFDEASCGSYSNGNLKIICCKSVISAELKMKEGQLKTYVEKHVSQTEIKRVIYRIK